ncbi:hypothetical protein FE257_004784 [Aspergillus nanangensis]|uniref:Secretory lipase-domain-containing protein n=1 Tax=Aspergillus nanangensis TaxID=2582783 RepID=A0AAD4GW15_ASPNN|nr:hypothetical protein FE257_004784 [Aspergillus nanangensis]
MHFTPHILSLLAIGAIPTLSLEPPILPSEDPFYIPQDPSWASLPPGTILASRNITFSSILPGLPSRSQAYQLLYVTKDVHNNPAHTVTTIVIPPNPNFAQLLSLQLAYDSPDINCSPSYGLQYQATGAAASWNQFQLSLVLPYLLRGPILNIPDYEGSNAAFAVGPQSGYQVLDSIRAALSSGPFTNILPDAKAVMFGYSGGAFATEWAAEMHPERDYADIPIAGAAIGGLTPNITKTYLSVNGSASAGLNAWAILGMMNAFPDLKRYMDNQVLPEFKEAFYGPLTRCSPRTEPVPDLAFMNISSFFRDGEQFLVEFAELLNRVGDAGQYGIPDFPLFMYHGTNDDIAPDITDIDALVTRLCQAGTRVVYHRYLGLDHSGALIAGMVPAWAWISSVFEGFVPRGCYWDNLDPTVPGRDPWDSCGLKYGNLSAEHSSLV